MSTYNVEFNKSVVVLPWKLTTTGVMRRYVERLAAYWSYGPQLVV